LKKGRWGSNGSGLVKAEWGEGRSGCTHGPRYGEAMYVEASRDSLEGALGIFDVGIELSDVVLEPLDPALLLGNTLATFFFTAVDQLREVISQSFILLVPRVGESGTDNSDDGWGKGSHM